MNIRSLLIVLLFSIQSNIIAQSASIDSLQKLVEKQSVADTTKINLLCQLASHYIANQNDSGLVYTEQALNLSRNQPNFIEVFNLVKTLGHSMTQVGNIALHRACFQQLKKTSLAVKNDSLFVVSLYGLAVNDLASGKVNESLKTINQMTAIIKDKGIVVSPLQTIVVNNFKAELYNVLQQYDKAIHLHIQTLKLAEQHNIVDQQAISLSGLSKLHLGQENYDKAVEYGLKALELDKEMNNPAWAASTYLDLGAIYIKRCTIAEERKDEYFEAAKRYFELALKKGKEADYAIIQGIAYLNLGGWYYGAKELDKSKENLEQAISLLQPSGDQANLLRAYNKLAQLHWSLVKDIPNKSTPDYETKLRVTTQYAAKAYNSSARLGIIDVQKTSSKLLSSVYSRLDSFEQAYHYLKIHQAIADSVQSEEKIKIIEEAEAKFQNEKQSLEIDLLNAENERQTTVSYGLGAGSIIILIFLLILYRQYQQKQKANKDLVEKNTQITQQKEEKEILLKEIHHRVKNNLQIISSLLDLQSNGIEDEVALSVIEDGQYRVKSMALIHHKLYQNENIATINFKDYTEQLVGQIMDSLSLEELNATIDIDYDTIFDVDTAIPLGLILNELLTNAYKYAFHDKQLQIRIKLTELEKGNYQLEVKDNGPGMPNNFNLRKAKSLGLRLVKLLSTQLLGKATYQNNEEGSGAHFIITFKDSFLRKNV